jgi:hypothetical protein
MGKKIRIWLFLFLSSLSVQSQVNKERVLEAFLNDAALGKFVIPEFYKYCDTLHIIDTTNIFSDKVSVKFSKAVLIDRQYIKLAPSQRQYCYIFISELKVIKNTYYLLSYFHEPSNSTGFIRYKLIKGRLKKLNYEHGQY